MVLPPWDLLPERAEFLDPTGSLHLHDYHPGSGHPPLLPGLFWTILAGPPASVLNPCRLFTAASVFLPLESGWRQLGFTKREPMKTELGETDTKQETGSDVRTF